MVRFTATDVLVKGAGMSPTTNHVTGELLTGHQNNISQRPTKDGTFNLESGKKTNNRMQCHSQQMSVHKTRLFPVPFLTFQRRLLGYFVLKSANWTHPFGHEDTFSQKKS